MTLLGSGLCSRGHTVRGPDDVRISPDLTQRCRACMAAARAERATIRARTLSAQMAQYEATGQQRRTELLAALYGRHDDHRDGTPRDGAVR